MQATLDLDLQGIWINNREYFQARLWSTLSSYFNVAVLGWDVAQMQIPAADFVHKYENVFAFKLVPDLLRFSLH